MKYPVIASNFKLFKAYDGVNAATLAKRFKCSNSAIESYVDGRAMPGAELLIRVANYYGLKPEQVLHQRLTDKDLKPTGHTQTITEVKLEAAEKEIALLRAMLADKTKIIELYENRQ